MLIQHGEEKGWAGLDRLPALLAACDRRWGLNDIFQIMRMEGEEQIPEMSLLPLRQ
jgi:hypothetical protein